jgi:hypothetical protein
MNDDNPKAPTEHDEPMPANIPAEPHIEPLVITIITKNSDELSVPVINSVDNAKTVIEAYCIVDEYYVVDKWVYSGVMYEAINKSGLVVGRVEPDPPMI